MIDNLEDLVQSVIDLTFKNTFYMKDSSRSEKINYITGKVLSITKGSVDPRAIQDMAKRLVK